MKRQDLLIERLKEYRKSEMYPFHMPGHKREVREFLREFPNPFSVDITEINGFDNLHHPEGILKKSMEWASEVYGSDKSYYLINGSSGGILSAISAAVKPGNKIIIGRNCHKSVYHGVILRNLKTAYVYPQIIKNMWINGGITADDVEKALEENPDARAVLIVSPSYDGIVSDIEKIAETVHKKGIPLIVDEAHGAHFSIKKTDLFPISALDLGADIVIQSLHKTLPSLTQTGILHVKSKYIDKDRLEWYLQAFQSSSPSYILMAGIEQCIFEISEHGEKYLEKYEKNLTKLRTRLKNMNCLRLLDKSTEGKYGIYRIDPSKIVVSSAGTFLNDPSKYREDQFCHIGGAELSQWLREDYHLEMEMYGADYVVAITTFFDTESGMERLAEAFTEIDKKISKNRESAENEKRWSQNKPNIEMTLAEAMETEWESLLISDCTGKISAEFVYLYPPGIPIVVPGERISKEIVDQIEIYKKKNLPVQGMADHKAEYLRICIE